MDVSGSFYIGIKGEKKQMVKSTITGKQYNPDNSSVVYLSNFQQIYKYLCAGAEEDLVDILYTNTRNNCLVFVFKKSSRVKHLYELWNNHEL